MTDDLPITAFDLAALGVLALSTALALVRGGAREVLSILTWIGAFVVAYHGFAGVSAALRRTIESALVADALALVLVFLVPLIVFKVAAAALARRVHDSGRGSFDRVAGVAFGVARGALIVCLAYLGLSLAVDPRDHPRWVREARSLPYVREGVELLRGFVPEDIESRGRAVAGEALRRADEVRGQADAARRLIEPPEASSPPSSGEFGYPRSDADAMDRLIEGR